MDRQRSPDDLERGLADFRKASERREPFEVEYRLRRADGQWRWILVRGVPQSDADGFFAGYIGSGIDLTERVSRLQQVTAALAEAGTPDDVLETMVKEGMDAMGASAGSVAVLDPDGTTLEVARAAGYSEALLEAFGRMDLSADVPLAEATRIGAPVVCGDLDELARR